jgi:hypothetical protein
VVRGGAYSLSLYLRNPQSTPLDLHVCLVSAGLNVSYAEATITAGSRDEWTKYEAALEAQGTDHDARLVLSFKGPATLVVDSVSLFPAENVEKGKALGHLNPWPFRKDLLGALKDLEPG